jgi:hypothetical protein
MIKAVIDTIVTNGVRGERILSDEFFPDPKDVVFYEVAMSKEDAYLVTGNIKHFPKKPIVVTPAEMLEILQREGAGTPKI